MLSSRCQPADSDAKVAQHKRGWSAAHLQDRLGGPCRSGEAAEAQHQGQRGDGSRGAAQACRCRGAVCLQAQRAAKRLEALLGHSQDCRVD